MRLDAGPVVQFAVCYSAEKRIAANIHDNVREGFIMAWVAITVVVALLEYLAFGFMVGAARVKYGVPAPAISGNEVFERYFRVHQNTLEQLVAFLPGIWLFGTYVNPVWAALLGAVFILGRAMYAASYIRDPKARGAGFGLTFLSTVILLLGGLYGAVRTLL